VLPLAKVSAHVYSMKTHTQQDETKIRVFCVVSFFFSIPFCSKELPLAKVAEEREDSFRVLERMQNAELSVKARLHSLVRDLETAGLRNLYAHL
jgi:hypothetical protein